MEPPFTIGIEEEYMLVHADSLDLVRSMPRGFLKECKSALGQMVMKEYLQCQVEVATSVCDTIEEARRELATCRSALQDIAARYDCMIMAASTHPFSTAATMQSSDQRYAEITEQMQGVARRLTICGMHVHVGIGEDDLRIDLMNQAIYTLPHLLALSTSSPFWKGQNTGLKSYRVSVFDEMPRTGLPEEFDDNGEYQRSVQVLTDVGAIEDATKLWWDLRPSYRFPTLEMRLTDICTLLDDAVAIAAVFRCWLHMLYRLKQQNQRWRVYKRFLIAENRWRAHRYGMDEGMIDFGKGEIVEFGKLLEELVDLVTEDARHFGCLKEVRHVHRIYRRGSSAHRQLAVYDKELEKGNSSPEALRAVVKDLIRQTQLGVDR